MSYSIVLFFNLFFHILEIIWTLKVSNNFSNCKILIFQMVKLFFKKMFKFLNFVWFEKSLIFQIEQFQILGNFLN